MNWTIAHIATWSIVIAGVIGIFRIKEMDPAYYPFLILTFIGIGNETLSYLLVFNGMYTTVNNNVYVLIEGLLIGLFFDSVRLFRKQRTLLITLFSLLFVWILEVSLRGINTRFNYFRIFYSFIIVLLSINMINKLLLSEKRGLLRNSMFLFCIAFIIYFTLKVLQNAFWIYGLNKNSNSFLGAMLDIHTWVNLLTNLIYALAVLWIPRKQASILPL